MARLNDLMRSRSAGLWYASLTSQALLFCDVSELVWQWLATAANPHIIENHDERSLAMVSRGSARTGKLLVRALGEITSGRNRGRF